MQVNKLALALVLALVGCGRGCDSEGRKGVTSPKPPADVNGSATDQGTSVASDEVAPEVAAGFLDAPVGTLDGLFGGLAATDRGDTTVAGRVLLVFFGDSHTAGDSMTSRLRSTWQTRFGDAGRCLVAAGRPPTRHYYQRDVHYGRAGDWTATVGGARGDQEPFGIDGIRVSGRGKGASLWVETCPDCLAGKSVAQFEILYYAAPDHGLLRYRVDEKAWQQLATKTAAIEPPHPGRQVITVDDGPHK